MSINELMDEAVIYYGEPSQGLRVTCYNSYGCGFTDFITIMINCNYRIVRIKVPKNWDNKFKTFIGELV